MADNDLTAMGPIVDQLGVKADLVDGEQITDVLVLARVVNPADTGDSRVALLFSPGTDAIVRTGMYYAASSYIDEAWEPDEE